MIAAARCVLLLMRMPARDHCALARANRVFCTDEKRIGTENTVMQLPRNNCHIRVNDFVI